jgi:hypothetical protein
VAGADAARAASLNGEPPEQDASEQAVFFPAQPLLDALVATKADGISRHTVLADRSHRELDTTVCRSPDGQLQLRISDPAREAGEPLRRLARQMAEETDTPALLEILCDAATEQCAAAGAAVLKATTHEGELVAASGPLAVARGRRFALPGSLAREVIRTRDIVAVDDFSTSSRPLTKVVPELRVGPMLLAPLIAHDVILGVLVATREIGGPPINRRRSDRFGAIAE